MKLKAVFGIAVLLSSVSALASQDCGVRESSAALATIDMELNLLNSGLYVTVRAEALQDISRIVLGHVNAIEACNPTSGALKQNATDSINRLVINNPDGRDYSIGTAQRIYGTFRENLRLLDLAADQDLESKLKSCH